MLWQRIKKSYSMPLKTMIALIPTAPGTTDYTSHNLPRRSDSFQVIGVFRLGTTFSAIFHIYIIMYRIYLYVSVMKYNFRAHTLSGYDKSFIPSMCFVKER